MPMIPRNFAQGGAGSVPDTFAPSVDERETPFTPANSPWVKPMQNAAPGLLQQTGETLMQAGETASKIGNTIGDRVQETMDDAQTKAAETQFLGAAMPMLGRYKTTEGINATQQWDPTTQAIAKARQDARATLTNPIQQHMFDQVTNDHMVTFGAQMADHENVQRVQYGKDQSQARAANLNQLSTLDVAGRNRPDSSFAKFSSQSDAEVLNYASLNGVAADSPQAQEMLRQNRTSRYRSVITSLLDDHAYNEAQDFFDEHKGEMDITQAEVMGNAVKAATKAEKTTTDQNMAVQSLQKTPGAGPLTQPIPAGTISTTNGVDGIDIHAAPGTSVKAPASGTVTKVWTNEQQGLSAEVTLPNGYVATLSGLSAVNYKPGQKITQGQELGISGQDDNGAGVTHYAMTDPTGKIIDPRSAVSAPYDPKNFSSPDDEEKAVEWVNANVQDPVERRQAESQVRSLANMNRGILNQEHEAALKQATDFWFQNGQSLSNLPAQVKMQLTPEDLNSFTQRGLQQYELGQREKDISSVSLRASWIDHPDQMTVDNVRTAYAQGHLSDNEYERCLAEAKGMEGAPDKIRAATFDADRLKSFADQAGLNVFGTQTPQDKQRLVSLHDAVQTAIDEEQRAKGRELTLAEKDALMRNELTRVTLNQLRSNSNPLVRMGVLGVNAGPLENPYRFELPRDSQGNIMPDTKARAYVIDRLKQGGISNPTDDQIGTYYREALKH